MNKDEEVVDLVNEKDEVIGEVLKVNANRDPSLWHREIAVILFDSDNRILFQQRSKNKVVRPGFWAISCAGHIPKGMDIDDAAHMELKEELGFDTSLLFIEKTLFKGENETHFINWYLGKYSGEEISLEEEEVEQTRWFDKEDFEKFVQSGELSVPEDAEAARKFWNGEFDQLKNQL